MKSWPLLAFLRSCSYRVAEVSASVVAPVLENRLSYALISLVAWGEQHWHTASCIAENAAIVHTESHSLPRTIMSCLCAEGNSTQGQARISSHIER